jgi:hypothetical protein
VTRLRLADNRLHDVGPVHGARGAGIRVLPPFDHVAVDGNAIFRLSGGNVDTGLIEWCAIDIGPEPILLARHFAAAAFVLADDAAFVLTTNRLVLVPLREPTLAVDGNHLGATSSSAPVVRIGAMHHCLFTRNTCQAHGEMREPTIGLIQSRTITVTDNRLRSIGDFQTMHLHPQVERAIVMGNTSTGPIALFGAASVPPDIGLTNIFNV